MTTPYPREPFRAGYWLAKDKQSSVLLTRLPDTADEHFSRTDEELKAEAENEMRNQSDIDWTGGDLVINYWWPR
jgi:hypothetical protein